MQLDSRQTILLAILVLLLGKFFNSRVSFLRRFTIPDPVTGGILASGLLGLLHLTFGLDVMFSDHYRDVLLVVFFTCIGLETDIRNILSGGRVLGLLAVLAVLYLFVQSLLGVLVAEMFGIDPNIGILVGSTSLQGGHGNVVAWAPILTREHGVTGGMELGVATATFGLILGGLLGGPVARFLIGRHDLSTSDDSQLSIGKKQGESLVIDYDSALRVLLLLAVSIGMGIHLGNLSASLGFAMPLFVPCMFSGLLLSNVLSRVLPTAICPPGSPTLAITSELSLGLFLAMAMMGLRFWEIGANAVFLVVNLILQVALILVFATVVVFRALGRNYDSAVITAGYLGSALGATPTAMANMAAVTQRFGASPEAFIVIPLVAAFITQITNSVVIQFLLNVVNG